MQAREILKLFAALAAGLIFGLGLILSQMVSPMKVLAFLDITAAWVGAWDPSLAFVMGGALLVTMLGFRLVLRRPAPLLDSSFRLPAATSLDTSLIGGAALFGIGWGIAGFCPGPALTALGAGVWQAGVFVAAMAAGMMLHGAASKRGGVVHPQTR